MNNSQLKNEKINENSINNKNEQEINLNCIKLDPSLLYSKRLDIDQ